MTHRHSHHCEGYLEVAKQRETSPSESYSVSEHTGVCVL